MSMKNLVRVAAQYIGNDVRQPHRVRVPLSFLVSLLTLIGCSSRDDGEGSQAKTVFNSERDTAEIIAQPTRIGECQRGPLQTDMRADRRRAVADFDCDGVLDTLAMSWDSTVRPWKWVTVMTGSVEWRHEDLFDERPEFVSFADINDDGMADALLVWLTMSGSSPGINLIRRDGQIAVPFDGPHPFYELHEQYSQAICTDHVEPRLVFDLGDSPRVRTAIGIQSDSLGCFSAPTLDYVLAGDTLLVRLSN